MLARSAANVDRRAAPGIQQIARAHDVIRTMLTPLRTLILRQQGVVLYPSVYSKKWFPDVRRVLWSAYPCARLGLKRVESHPRESLHANLMPGGRPRRKAVTVVELTSSAIYQDSRY
jgi:hypothetical protein